MTATMSAMFDEAISVETAPTPLSTSLDQVPSAAKALMLLDAFVGGPPSLGVTEIARAAGVTKSTAFRLLAVLADYGFVARHGSRYSLGDRLFELGSHTTYSRPRSIRDVATPYLADLYATYRSTVHLAALDGGQVLYLEKLYGPGQASSPSHVGSKLPATITAVGKALLAHAGERVTEQVLAGEMPRRTAYSITDPALLRDELADIRGNGFAVDREESTLGLNCFAAPVVVGQRVVASVSICTSSAGRSTPEQLVSAVRRAAADIAKALPRSSAELIGTVRGAA